MAVLGPVAVAVANGSGGTGAGVDNVGQGTNGAAKNGNQKKI